MSTTPPTKPCPECGGYGRVYAGEGRHNKCPTCSGTGVVAPEHSRTIVAHGTTTHYLDEPCEFCDSADNSHDEPTPAHPAATPPAATDEAVMEIIEQAAYKAIKAVGLGDLERSNLEALAALEAHYAARFERAIGEDGDNWPDSEVNGEEDFRQALAEESQNNLRAEARSGYYGEQAGGSDE